jgi:uncharacterized protein (DUF433 family)/plasmid stability protein
MASITIRNLDEEIKNRLRIRAAQNGRSMEEELRVILQAVAFNEQSEAKQFNITQEPASSYRISPSSGQPTQTDFQDKFGNKITIDLGKRFGKPCINDTRIAVDDVLEWFASGMAIDDIMGDFPELTEDQIKLALCYAATRLS